jgi:lipopolysaccharide export system permease protein
LRLGLLDRYLAKEILLPFGAGLLFLTQILLATQILSRAEILFGSGVSAADVLTVVVALVPQFVNTVLPIAFLLGAVLGVARLAEDREVIAMGAAGISPLHLVRVPLALGVVFSAVGLWLALEVEPASLTQAREGLNAIVKKNVQNDVQPGTFYDQIPGYTLYAERVSPGGWENVLIHDRSNPDAPVLALARHGRLEPLGGGREMRLELRTGDMHREQASGDEYIVAEFDRAELVVALGRSLSDPGLRELTVPELVARSKPGPDRPERDAKRTEAFLWRKIAAPLAMLPFALLAVPLGASRRSGRAFGVTATFLAVVVHYLLLRGGEVLALRNALPAPVALQIPTIGLALVALVLIANQARRGVGAVR